MAKIESINEIYGQKVADKAKNCPNNGENGRIFVFPSSPDWNKLTVWEDFYFNQQCKIGRNCS